MLFSGSDIEIQTVFIIKRIENILREHWVLKTKNIKNAFF